MLRPTIPYVAVIPFFLRVFNWSSIVFSTYVYPSCTRCAINLIIITLMVMMTMMILLKLEKSFQIDVTFLCEKFAQDCASFASD